MASVLCDLFKENTYVEMDYPSGMRTRPGCLRHRQNVRHERFIRIVGDVAELIVWRIRQLWHVRVR